MSTTLIPSRRRTNALTVARLQRALDAEFERPVCEIGREKGGILVAMDPRHEGRRPYVVAFVAGFLSARP